MLIIGFALATLISIYKQNSIANKANRNVATTKLIMQELESTKESMRSYQSQIEHLRIVNDSYSSEIRGLQYQLSNFECPIAQPAPECPKYRNGMYPAAPKKDFPDVFEIFVENHKYYCRSR